MPREKKTTKKAGKAARRLGGSAAVTTKATKATKAKATKAKVIKVKTAKASKDTSNGRAGGALVIVESPTKARTIGKYLGRGYAVKATVGHLRDLPTRKLGVTVDDGGKSFTPEYVTIKGKTQTLSEIKKAAKGAREVLLATDPDREGEAIAWHVASQLGDDIPLRLKEGEAGLVKSPFGWHVIKRVPPPPPDPLESVDILKREPVTQKAKVKHILLGWKEVNTGSDERAKKRDRAALEKLVKQTVAKLNKGAKIEPLMKELSEDPGSAQSGEGYDVTPDAGLVEPFKNLSLRLNPGEVGVVKTDFGIHIIQRVE